MSIIVDSGASDSVTHQGVFDTPVIETQASREGLSYTGPDGSEIKNIGATKPFIELQDGTQHSMTFQVAEVTKTLGAVNRIVAAGNRVVFEDRKSVV